MLVEGLVVQEGRPLTPIRPVLLEFSELRIAGNRRGELDARRAHSQPFRQSVRRCSNFSSPHLLMVTAA